MFAGVLECGGLLARRSLDEGRTPLLSLFLALLLEGLVACKSFLPSTNWRMTSLDPSGSEV